MENGNREMPGSWKHKSHKAAASQRNAQLSPTSNGCSLPPSINCPLENLRISIRQNLDDHTHSQVILETEQTNKQINKQTNTTSWQKVQLCVKPCLKT